MSVQQGKRNIIGPRCVQTEKGYQVEWGDLVLNINRPSGSESLNDNQMQIADAPGTVVNDRREVEIVPVGLDRSTGSSVTVECRPLTINGRERSSSGNQSRNPVDGVEIGATCRNDYAAIKTASVHGELSEMLTENPVVPAAVGVPVMFPELSILSPAGKAPATIEYV